MTGRGISEKRSIEIKKSSPSSWAWPHLLSFAHKRVRYFLHTDLEFVAVAVAEALEDEDEKLVEHLEDLVVVLVNFHLQVQPRELGQVPVRVRILRPENCGENKKNG
jgi:hypothetical protein